MSRAAAKRLAYFGQDCTDSAVIRRVASFHAAGLQVLGFTFRRLKFNRDYRPDWDNVDLGTTADRQYLRRLGMLLRAGWTMVRKRRELRESDIIYARNIDMALLALWGKLVSGSRAPLVYEVLDVNRVFSLPGLKGAVARWVERQVLERSRLLVVSSPAFISEYFDKVQGFRGDWFLLENKICAAQLPDAPRFEPSRPAPGEPWVIGWFGTMRCVRSLSLLTQIADALPDKVRIDLRGFPTETGLERFLQIIADHPNMVYGGEFKSPQDLDRLYGGVHLAWCFDYHDADANSRWLLPNRLYDAAYHAVPQLAAAGTYTGRRVEEQGLGWTFPEPLVPDLIAFLKRLTPDEWAARHAAIAALPATHFRDDSDIPALVARVLSPPGAAGAGQSAFARSQART